MARQGACVVVGVVCWLLWGVLAASGGALALGGVGDASRSRTGGVRGGAPCFVADSGARSSDVDGAQVAHVQEWLQG